MGLAPLQPAACTYYVFIINLCAYHITIAFYVHMDTKCKIDYVVIEARYAEPPV